MMNTKKSYIQVGLIFLVTLSDAIAQQPPPVFRASDYSWMDSEDSRSLDFVKNHYADEIENSEWATIFISLAEDFKQTGTDWSNNKEVYRLFEAHLDTLAQEFENIYLSGEDYYRSLDTIETARFNRGTEDGMIIYFNFYSKDVLLCPPVMRDMSPCDSRTILSEEQARDLRYRAYTIQQLLTLFKDEPRNRIVSAIETSHKKWSNYMDRGFTMYPWEAKINSHLLTWDIKSPPERQFIILHPSLAVQVPTGFLGDIKDLRFRESLMIEFLGIMKYRGDHLRNYSGLSGTVVLRPDIAPGIGGLIHISRGLSVGLNFHLSEEAGKKFIKNPFLSVSIDLLSALKANRAYEYLSP